MKHKKSKDNKMMFCFVIIIDIMINNIMTDSKLPKYKICVMGAAETEFCAPNTNTLAEQIGREIVRQGAILLAPVSTGIPLWAAKGAKEEGAFVVGLSPAESQKEHIEKYDLPTDFFDMIIYTGYGFSGRNLHLVKSVDAVILVCGRMGTLNVFTLAFEDNKPIGLLKGSGGIAEEISHLVDRAHRGEGKIVEEKDPKILVQKVIELIKKEHE